MLDYKPISTLMKINVKLCSLEGKDLEDAIMYRQLVNSLINLTLTRFDISHVIGVVSQFMHKPKKSHLKAVHRILKYIKSTIDYGIFYKKDMSCKIIRYCDIDYVGNHGTLYSTNEYIFTLISRAICWCSKR